MFVKTGISGTSLNNFSIGDGKSSDKIIYADKNVANNPCLKYNNTNSNWQFSNDGINFNSITSSVTRGDCDGYSSNARVIGLNEIGIINNIPKDGYCLFYNKIQNKWIPNIIDQLGIFSGDLSGDLNSSKVIGFNGIDLTNDLPLDGYGYVYNSNSSKFELIKINNNSSIITVGSIDALASLSIKYLLPDFTTSDDESSIAFLAPTNGTLSNLTIYGDSSNGSDLANFSITVRKNKVNTSITLDTLVSTKSISSNIINTENILAGDEITFKFESLNGWGVKNLFVSLIFTIPVNNKSLAIVGSNISSGPFSNIPATNITGNIYFATDAYVSEWVSDNSTWYPLIAGRIIGTRPPLASTFTPINTGGATLVDANGSLLYTGHNDGANVYFRGFGLTNTSSTAYVEASFLLKDTGYNIAGYKTICLGMREISTDKSLHLIIHNYGTTTPYIQMNSWNGSNVSTGYAETTSPDRGIKFALIYGKVFLRVRRDATTIYFYFSWDRIYWCLISSYAISSYFTTAPDQVTIGAWSYNDTAIYNVVHFKTGSL